MSQKETTSGVLGIIGFILGVLLMLVIYKPHNLSPVAIKENPISKSSVEDRESNKNLLVRLANDNSELKESIASLKAAVSSLSEKTNQKQVTDNKQVVVTLESECRNELRSVNSRVNSLENIMSEKYKDIQSQLVDLNYSTKGYLTNSWITDQKINELSQLIKDLKKNGLVEKAVEVHNPVVTQPLPQPVLKQAPLVIKPEPQVPTPPEKPIQPKKVATVKKGYDVDPSLGPDDTEVKPKYKNDQLK